FFWCGLFVFFFGGWCGVGFGGVLGGFVVSVLVWVLWVVGGLGFLFLWLELWLMGGGGGYGGGVGGFLVFAWDVLYGSTAVVVDDFACVVWSAGRQLRHLAVQGRHQSEVMVVERSAHLLLTTG
ncbi:hypothetical protein PUR71_01545, partial [Streptomyces sp. SP17BM10]|nr:hypothetical protein [Streptomyces sp. SP17BM10]